MVADEERGYAYFATNGERQSSVVRIGLQQFVVNDTLVLPKDTVVSSTGTMDPNGEYAYFGYLDIINL